jgi:ubiquinone/menaquinone biosynthesis C-methylase UbiE
MAEKSSYDGLLACARCGYIVPVIRGVPRFVSESVDAGFDERWRRYPKFQATTAGIFEEKTGFSKAMLGGKTVLDAGCGCGRFAAVAQGMGAKVIGVDGSAHALLAATENVSGAEFLQANILALPLRDESVDHAFSIGVLHHTESTERAFKEVARTVRRGGSFAVWVYAKPASDDRWLAPMEMLHEITRSVPPRVLSEIFAKWAPKIRDGYAGGWGALEQVLRVSSSRDAEECASDTFDWHCPTYRWWHGAEEVKRWFIEAGFDVDRVGNFPTSVRGVRVR